MKVTNSQSRIQELLTLNDESQSDMARKTDLTRTSKSRYVRGVQEPNQYAINQIATAYRVNPAWLMGYNVSMQTQDNKEILKKIEMLTEEDKFFVLGIIDYLAERGKA